MAPRPPLSSETRTGLLAGAGAYLIWGLLPLYLKQLVGMSAADVLGQRVLWSLLWVGLLLALMGGGAKLRSALAQPRLLALLFGSALAIGANWLVYMDTVLGGHVIDASLGYFINPLINVLFGVALLGERLGRLQWVAVGLALAGVAVVAVDRGSLPLASIGIAGSFAIYGLIRKRADVDAATGLFLETAMLAPMALLWLATRPEGPFAHPPHMLALLAASGIVTAAPLILFSIGARRLKLTTLGLMQYSTPTVVLLQAVWLFGETLDRARIIAFVLIWSGLALYTWTLFRRPSVSAIAGD